MLTSHLMASLLPRRQSRLHRASSSTSTLLLTSKRSSSLTELPPISSCSQTTTRRVVRRLKSRFGLAKGLAQRVLRCSITKTANYSAFSRNGRTLREAAADRARRKASVLFMRSQERRRMDRLRSGLASFQSIFCDRRERNRCQRKSQSCLKES